jgi:transposase InsO family protein
LTYQFVDDHRKEFGVEPICRVLQIAPSAYRAHAAQQRDPTTRCVRRQWDERLCVQITDTWQAHRRVYGARKVWKQLHRDGTPVARCTVERLMQHLGLHGVVRGARRRTTVPDELAARPLDLVQRDFSATRPNQLWVADFT